MTVRYLLLCLIEEVHQNKSAVAKQLTNDSSVEKQLKNDSKLHRKKKSPVAKKLSGVFEKEGRVDQFSSCVVQFVPKYVELHALHNGVEGTAPCVEVVIAQLSSHVVPVL